MYCYFVRYNGIGPMFRGLILNYEGECASNRNTIYDMQCNDWFKLENNTLVQLITNFPSLRWLSRLNMYTHQNALYEIHTQYVMWLWLWLWYIFFHNVSILLKYFSLPFEGKNLVSESCRTIYHLLSCRPLANLELCMAK